MLEPNDEANFRRTVLQYEERHSTWSSDKLNSNSISPFILGMYMHKEWKDEINERGGAAESNDHVRYFPQLQYSSL